jgi:glycerol-3-phosphate O-acyltransferase
VRARAEHTDGARDQAPATEELHPTAMIERPGPVLRWLVSRFFKEIAFPDELAAQLRAAAARGQLVYVFRTLSYLDYLYFAFAFLRLGLPLARFANGLTTILFATVGQIRRGLAALVRSRRDSPVAELRRVVERGDSAALFLRRPRTLLGLGREPRGFRAPYVEELIAIQRARPPGAPPLILVPLVLLWGSPAVRAAKTRKGLLDLVFGGSEDPGRLRALFQFFVHYRDSQVLGGKPIDLGAFLEMERAANDGVDPSTDVLARRLRWMLAGAIESEVRVVLGPPRKGSARIREEVLRARKVVSEAQAIAREEGITQEALARRARKLLAEIAAEPKPWAFGILAPLVRWMTGRIFDGVDVDEVGLERVREAARRGPLLLVPSHKSHIDYLVLSNVFLEHDLVPPHIAAGANLSFFPLGPIFRRCGAFFLRRSFKGDRLYGVLFRGYVRRLLREGYSIEFFIEGGRSRTGKLLPPKLGLLGMIVEGALEDDGQRARQAMVVPVSIGYEKVIEEKSYARELAGGEKRKESVGGLLRATRVLAGEYGRLNIQFDEPFALGEALRELGAIAAWDEEAGVAIPAEEAARRRATERLAHRIVNGINRVTAITPTSLTAAALLGTGRRGIARADLLDMARFLVERARAVGGRLAPALVGEGGRLSIDALDRALDLLQRDGDLEIRNASGTAPGARRSDDEIYTVPDDRRPRLAFYRNNAIHLYVNEALVALALVSATGGSSAGLDVERVIARGLLQERTLRLSRLLKLEFSFRVGETFESIFDATVAGMVASGLLAPAADGALRGSDSAGLVLLAGQVRDFVESYLVVARALAALPADAAPMTERDLVRRIQELGETLFFTGEVRRREACIVNNYKNAIARFVESGLLVSTGEGRDRRLRPADAARRSATVVELRDLLGPE